MHETCAAYRPTTTGILLKRSAALPDLKVLLIVQPVTAESKESLPRRHIETPILAMPQCNGPARNMIRWAI
jgi:hypothetical protein